MEIRSHLRIMAHNYKSQLSFIVIHGMYTAMHAAHAILHTVIMLTVLWIAGTCTLLVQILKTKLQLPATDRV